MVDRSISVWKWGSVSVKSGGASTSTTVEAPAAARTKLRLTGSPDATWMFCEEFANPPLPICTLYGFRGKL